ncbi:Utp11p [Lipomyces japonicus]|uniref:Utp11p n=1 Tax=Lipomyces japonicus TaxID=56871 RepID=UPI0034CE1943
MSSLKFSVQNKTHRERAQPSARRKWGLLEKHKDYVLRAKDFHAKESRLKILREKATARNPDEFYHGMLSSKTASRTNKRGIKETERESSISLSNAEVRLLKTQDEGYVVTVINQEKHKIDRIMDRLAFHVDNDSHWEYSDQEDQAPELNKGQRKRMRRRKRRENPSRVHRVFADSVQEARTADFKQSPKLNQQISRPQELLIRELNERRSRLSQLEKVLNEIQLQRKLMAPGSKKKIENSDGTVTWKWKTQRKR